MQSRARPDRIGMAVGLSVAVGAVLVLGVVVLSSDGDTPTSGAAFDPTIDEEVPDGYRRLLDRDQIAPVYDPVFTTPGQVDWPDDSLVIGVAGDEAAKAYPVTHLNRREMVLDELEGTPILVSW